MILTEQEIEQYFNESDGTWHSAYKRLEAKLLEKLKAQSVKSPDNGRWNTGITNDGRVFLQSDDFNHDVRLYVNGDFDGNITDYTDRLAAWMNSHQLPPDDVVRDAERYRWLRSANWFATRIIHEAPYGRTAHDSWEHLDAAIDAAMKGGKA